MPDKGAESVAFPHLSQETLTEIGQCSLTLRKTYRDGDALFRAGDRDAKFFIVLKGAVEIIDESGDHPNRVTVHTPGSFSGDVSQITGRPAIVSGYAQGETEVYEVSQAALKQMLNAHPDLADIIFQAFIARRQLLRGSGHFTGLRVIGPRSCPDTFRIRDFLDRNSALFTWIDTEHDPEISELLHRFNLAETDLPVVMFHRKLTLRKPSNRELADALGLRRKLEQKVYDLVIVGAGPAGLAAAVYGASEGLSTVLLERLAPGGQAGRSMRIENYLGFPLGITGSELSDRAVLQASKFGALLPIGSEVIRLSFAAGMPAIEIDGDESVKARCVLIATGADYRVLGVEGCDRLQGRGVYYAATPIEAQVCRGQDVIVVGGGNSAGQAAVYLAGQARKVYLVIRGDDLGKNMSSYLVNRVQQTANIELLTNTEVHRLEGSDSLDAAELVNRKTGETRIVRGPALFSFIGAVPRTEWLPQEIQRDDKQFVCTGAPVATAKSWPGKRSPFFLETSWPGVFAAGDVRSGSVKRVASAVGEGSMAVQFVHEHLKNSH